MTYTKFHASWSATDDLWGAAWNHIETQWTAIKADADAHNHDSRYYPKATADVTFFSTSYFTGFDADKLDGYHVSDIVAAVFPIGSILMWNSDSAPPTGWAVCNGGSGTPDLRDRFIICAAPGYVGWSGDGSYSVALSGSISIDAHTITNDEMPLHTHTFNDRNTNTAVAFTSAWRNAAVGGDVPHNGNTGSAGGGGSHGHPGSSISMNNINTVPSFYALYFIQKVS